MEEDVLFRHHTPVPPADLRVDNARALANFLESGINPFARLQECLVKVVDGTVVSEAIVLDVDVEVSQYPIYDIRQQERLAVLFLAGDKAHPEVLALRKDFPNVPHLYMRAPGYPPSLCLYIEPFEEVRLHWRAPAFVECIRQWLALTACGQLHPDDQPLEPLLFDAVEELILPEDVVVRDSAGAPEWLSIRSVPRECGLSTLIAERLDMTKPQEESGWVALVVSCPPQTHGVIRALPRTLEDLHNFVATSGLNLLNHLRAEMKGWMQRSAEEFERGLDARLILVLQLPKIRAANGDEVETVENRAFAVPTTIREIGADIGVWDLVEGKTGLLLGYDETRTGDATVLVPLNPRPAFTYSLAATVNGFESPIHVSTAAIGVGALGSQVVCNLVRAGFGQWTLIDDDVLLPHNLGRHSLYGFAVGRPKATALAEVLAGTIEGAQVAQGLVANVLQPEESTEQVQLALSGAQVILDMSASVPVARYLSHDLSADGRRMSLFLNPSGTALTLLAEDAMRQMPLVMLEMQLYRAIISNPDLGGLLDAGGRLRTGQACRDVSVQIPQDLVALHASIGSRAVRDAVRSDCAQITTWRVDDGYEVRSITIDPAQPSKEIVGGWTIHTDALLREKLFNLRKQRLPKETGGVLIGAYDMHRNNIYIVDAISSPPDSMELQTAYVRGTQGLSEEVQKVRVATAGMLHYLGEWHSHPDGSSLAPSRDDRKLLAWLQEVAEGDGTPTIMAIVGDARRLTFHVGDTTAKRQE